MAQASPISKLPFELLRTIILTAVAPLPLFVDRPSPSRPHAAQLARFSLVSHWWADVVRPELYRSITVTFEGGVLPHAPGTTAEESTPEVDDASKLLFDVLISSKDLQLLVRRLDFREAVAPKHHLALARLLRLLPNVEEMGHFRKTRYYFEDGWEYTVAVTAPQVRRLDMPCLLQPDLFPDLEGLTATMWSSFNSGSSAAFHLQSFAIKEELSSLEFDDLAGKSHGTLASLSFVFVCDREVYHSRPFAPVTSLAPFTRLQTLRLTLDWFYSPDASRVLSKLATVRTLLLSTATLPHLSTLALAHGVERAKRWLTEDLRNAELLEEARLLSAIPSSLFLLDLSTFPVFADTVADLFRTHSFSLVRLGVVLSRERREETLPDEERTLARLAQDKGGILVWATADGWRRGEVQEEVVAEEPASSPGNVASLVGGRLGGSRVQRMCFCSVQ